jgi:hypothetical protein
MIGNPLYTLDPDHVLGLLLVPLGLVGGWFVLRHRPSWLAGYRRLPALYRLEAWLLAATAVVHLGLVFTHDEPLLELLFTADALWLFAVLRRLLLGRTWRRSAALVLSLTIGAYWVAVLGGEPPDQVGLVTKLVELLALAIVLWPTSTARWRAVGGTVVLVALVFTTSLSSWIGAFRAAGGGAEHAHVAGAIPPPGTLLPATGPTVTTAADQAAADELVAATRVGIARFADLRVAAAAGYDVAHVSGLGYHAANAAYQRDGLILDPTRPETLVYAQTPGGAVLLGAMYQMPGLHQTGPQVAGPLTVWHAHEQVCLSLIPLGISGLLSPLGDCPVGSLLLPDTGEMLHVWTLPGVPQPFGDLDQAWLKDYLAGSGQAQAAAGGAR